MKYADAGVNLAVADDAKQRIRHLASRTFTPAVLGGIGGFGALFALDTKKWKDPVLVSSTDGVGTKLKIAMAMGVHSTVGGDLVNHCINDILVQGAEPLFFLDYLAMGKLDASVVEQLVDGMSRCCRKAGCALIGGETAEMPGFYQPGEYDLAGFIVGVVEREKVLTGKAVKPGDTLLALPSTGLHTNGYSLARQILFVRMRVRLEDYTSQLGCTFGEELLKVHRSYWPVVRKIRDSKFEIRNCLHGLAHITGGGFYDNIPRVLPKNCTAVIRRGSWDVLPIFKLLQENGGVADNEAYRVFNMGIGMVLIVDPAFVPTVHKTAAEAGVKSYLIGEIRKGKPEVRME